MRLYHVIAINERSGTKTLLTSVPLSHVEAVTMKGKFTPHKSVRIQLEPYEGPLHPDSLSDDSGTEFLR